ncbi:hypothetical protein BU24DRAFT_265331 [Aaosphaeria arxii CBS 175.79]|uniref:Uncharacterized protein n=1 Tax=Aaosphaeria arxii CBS 175.79 TaxID=1450172 RepID=A0A6A5XG84_9PLEO|nr:uncharacterized protein BU24DRAFT_265331 [Aaosphaeria arxii CBS 175.79]KAF2011866.1 hypothetical protein BU24DRAFT_265331 [Aaosphaeria arxii CBS 175.79]
MGCQPSAQTIDIAYNKLKTTTSVELRRFSSFHLHRTKDVICMGFCAGRDIRPRSFLTLRFPLTSTTIATGQTVLNMHTLSTTFVTWAGLNHLAMSFARIHAQHEDAILEAWNPTLEQKLDDFVVGTRRAIAPFVSRLRIDLSPLQGTGEASLFDTQRRYDYNSISQERQLKLMNPSLRNFLPRLEDIVAKMPKLKRLVIEIPDEWRSDGPAEIDFDVDEDAEEVGMILELDLLELVRDSIANMFSSPRINLPLLTYLRLTLPSTYDFSIIGPKIPETVALQLRHLYLEYIDGTGRYGDLQYTHGLDDSDTEGDEEHPFSNLQHRFPNTAYMRDMCALVNRCRNLESLGLHCTQPLDLDHLEWLPTASQGLKNIYIARAVTTAEKLISLITPSIIEGFHIQDVSLTSGTWESVFGILRACPSLKYFHVFNLIYSKHGKSRNRMEHNNRPWENVDFMWSHCTEDWRRFGDVVRAVQKRGGLVDEDTDGKALEVEVERYYGFVEDGN